LVAEGRLQLKVVDEAGLDQQLTQALSRHRARTLAQRRARVPAPQLPRTAAARLAADRFVDTGREAGTTHGTLVAALPADLDLPT
jgi:hypothetical protein